MILNNRRLAMRYKNTRTGAIIDSPCKIQGGNWIEYVEEEPEKIIKKVEAEEEPVEKDTENEEIDGITKKEIMQELDAFGIEYNPRAKKQELYNLMLESR
jgi:hypothetical protein